jgi:hypothetical protein
VKGFISAFLLLFSIGSWAQIHLTPLAVEERGLLKMDDSVHVSLLPLSPGFDVKNQLGADSMDVLEIHLMGALNAGIVTAPSLGGNAFSSVGVNAQLSVQNRFYAKARYAPVLGILPEYLQQWSDSLGILPGVGQATNEGGLWLGHYYTGRVGYNANEHFSFELGRGKHFWGDGYRSLIISDNAAPFPYFKLSTKVWKVKYVNLWTQQRDLTDIDVSLKDARRKFTTLHALSWQVSKRFNLSFYEMVVWQAKDTLSNRGVDINYLNPIIFYRPVEFALGSADNVLIGMSWRWEMNANNQLYGQILLDEFLLQELKNRDGWWANKFGIQLGSKHFDFITPGLHFFNELNLAKPFTYTHGSVLQAYGNQNQSLAHPLGTNFVEFINGWRYERDNWYIKQQWTWAIFGRDRDGENFGGDVFESYAGPRRIYGNYLAQGLKSTMHFEELEYGKQLSQNLDLWLFGNMIYRFEKNDEFDRTDWLFNIGLRTSLHPGYQDF